MQQSCLFIEKLTPGLSDEEHVKHLDSQLLNIRSNLNLQMQDSSDKVRGFWGPKTTILSKKLWLPKFAESTSSNYMQQACAQSTTSQNCFGSKMNRRRLIVEHLAESDTQLKRKKMDQHKSQACLFEDFSKLATSGVGVGLKTATFVFR